MDLSVLFAGLDGVHLAPDHIDQMIKPLIEVVVGAAAHAQNVALPRNPALLHELGWVLQGAISHLAIGQPVYGASQAVPLADILAIQITSFLHGLPAAAAMAQQQSDSLPSESDEALRSSVYD